MATAELGRSRTRGNNSMNHVAITIEPVFCPVEVADVFDTVQWDLRKATIKDENGGVLFEQPNCELPSTWSLLATNVVVSDPWANADEVKHEYGIELGTVGVDHPVDSLVVAVGHNEYRQSTPAQLRALCRGDKPVLADVKALYNRYEAGATGFTVFRL